MLMKLGLTVLMSLASMQEMEECWDFNFLEIPMTCQSECEVFFYHEAIECTTCCWFYCTGEPACLEDCRTSCFNSMDWWVWRWCGTLPENCDG